MKSRRRIAFSKAQDCADLRLQLQQGFATDEMGFRGQVVHGSNSEPPMSALGQKQTLRHFQSMSALPPKADIAECRCHLQRGGQIAEINKDRVEAYERRLKPANLTAEGNARFLQTNLSTA